MSAPAVAHEARVELVGGRYPYRPVCSCDALFWGYVAEHAAQILVDAHVAEVAREEVAR